MQVIVIPETTFASTQA